MYLAPRYTPIVTHLASVPLHCAPAAIDAAVQVDPDVFGFRNHRSEVDVFHAGEPWAGTEAARAAVLAAVASQADAQS